MNSNHARNWQREQIERRQPRRPQKEVIRTRKSGLITRGEKIIYSFFCMLFAAASIYVVAYSSSTDKLNREIQSLNEKVQQQKLENEDLVFEINELSKPERITKIAKENGLKIQETKVKRATKSND